MNERNAYGNTPLIVACKHAHDEDGKVLISAGALLYLRNRKGRNALYYAFKKNHLFVWNFFFGGLSEELKVAVLREHLLTWTALENSVRQSFEIWAVKAARGGFV